MPTLLHYSDVENAFDRPERIARLASALQSPPDAVVVGSGDELAGVIIASLLLLVAGASILSATIGLP